MGHKTLRFHSFAAYRKYLAFGHIHGKFTEKVQPKIMIAGKPHHVMHCEICGSKGHHSHAHNIHYPVMKKGTLKGVKDKNSIKKSGLRFVGLHPLRKGGIITGNTIKTPKVIVRI